MTAGASPTSSAAFLRLRSASPAPQRYSICTSWPTFNPNSCNRCRNAASRARASGSSAASDIATPISGRRGGCCARSGSGQIVIAPAALWWNRAGPLDHLVGDLLPMHRHGEAQCLRGLEIDDELIFRRRLHRHVGWFLTFQDAIDVAGSAPVQIDPIRAIGEQAAIGDEGTVEIYRGKLVPRRERDDQIAIEKCRST